MDFSALNVFDLVIVALVFLSTLFAFLRGFIRTIFSLMCWTLSVVCSVMLAPYLVHYLEGHMHSVWAVLLISYVGGFLVVFTLFAILFGFFVRMARPCCDGFIDRSLGAALGFLRGTLLACIIFSGITWALRVVSDNRDNPDYKGPEWMANAQSYNFLSVSSDFFASSLPKGLRHGMAAGFGRMGNLASSVVDPEGGGVGGVPPITDKGQETLNAVIAVLPERHIDHIDAYFGPVSSRMMAPEEIVDLRARTLLAYEDAVKNGEIIEENRLPSPDVASLKAEILAQAEALQKNEMKRVEESAKKNAEDPAAYSAEKLKMMERLLDQFK
ncbi:MAG: CvpA family protein [Rickettsiales bacterium]